MNVARSGSNGFWWHVAENPGGLGVYIRIGGDNDGVVLPREEAEAFLEGLREVLGAQIH